MVARKSREQTRPANKIRRKALHIKRKRAKDVARRELRFGRKKEEAKDPASKTERLRRNIPLTLERKRIWDDIDSDVEDALGTSIDVERLKRPKRDDLGEQDGDGGGDDDDDDDGGDNDDDDRADVDSMIATSDDEDSEDSPPSETGRGRKKSLLPSATDRATSPTQSTRSTNLNLAPEALAAKFPNLFPTAEEAALQPPPKILITTSLSSSLHHEAQLLTTLFPNSVYIRRTAHRHAHKFSVREIASFASNRQYTALVVLEGDENHRGKHPAGLMVVPLPHGPSFHFSVSNWIEGKRLPGHGNPTEHWPELILNNFRTPLGLLTAHLFRTLFPPQPHLEGRQVVTLHNQRDYIFVRRHRYVFREKRETEKSVVGADGKEIAGVEGIRTGLQELGPRFTLKLRRVDRGIQRSSGQEWEWKGKMEKERTKFQL